MSSLYYNIQALLIEQLGIRRVDAYADYFNLVSTPGQIGKQQRGGVRGPPGTISASRYDEQGRSMGAGTRTSNRKSTPAQLNYRIACGICFVVRDRFFMRNIVDKGVHDSARNFRGAFRAWAERNPVPCGGQVSILHRLPRSAHLLLYQVGKTSALARFILERWGHMRWWAAGAFGNKGRLEGSQYWAGRRAPPLLHRQPERLSDAGGQVCQPLFFRTF
jgi:hypothetical protein